MLIRNAVIRGELEIINLYGKILNNTRIKYNLKISVNKKTTMAIKGKMNVRT
jgi:hypothetical protein